MKMQEIRESMKLEKVGNQKKSSKSEILRS